MNIIERVTEEDASALLKIYSPYVLETAISFEYLVPSLEEFRERIRTISAKYPYLKASDEQGRILGYAYAGTFKSRTAYDWAVETTIYVRRECRGMGVGRKLYESLEQSLKAMGICNLNACIAYTPHEDPHLTNGSMFFHEKMGYRMVGTFHQCGYKFGSWYDMIWMEKLIAAHEQDQPPVRFGDWAI